LSFSLLHKLVAYLLSGLGLVALSLGTELEDSVVVAMLVAYAVSFFAEGPMLHRPRYNTGWTIAVVVALVLQVLRGVMTEATLAMAIEFAAFLQVSRLFNRRSAADYQQIAVLAFLHLVAATVLSTDVGYAVLFGGFVIVTPWMLALSHLRREIEGNYPAAAPDDEHARAAVGRVLASKRVVGPQFLFGTAALAVPLFIMTLAIFLAIPRVGRGFLTFDKSRGDRVAGFGNLVELGGFGVIRDDPTVVMRVTLLPEGASHPPQTLLRMRGTSFDRYDGRRWTRSPATAAALGRRGRTTYPLVRSPDRARDEAMRIVLDHLEEPVVFVPAGTVALEIPPRVESAQRIPRDLTHGPGLDIRYHDPDALGLVYTAYVTSDRAQRRLVAASPEPLERYLQVPGGHARVATLATQVVGDAATDEQKAQRLQAYLSSGEFAYTLEQPDVGSSAPLNAFLFEAKRGHCEYFSSAMAIMLRTLGIPARNVTGFVGGRFNPYGGYYALRQGDAHSWVEAWIPGVGWMTFDPTPPAREGVGPREGLWADVRALVDAMRTRWMTSVVGYDLRVQVGALRKLWTWWAAQRAASEARERATTADGDGDWLPSTPAVRWLIGFAIIVLFGALLVRWLRRRRGMGEETVSAHEREAVRLYRDLDRALASKGMARAREVTPLEHARVLGESGLDASEDIQRITRGYVEARYGGRVLSPDELAQLRAALARVRGAATSASRTTPRQGSPQTPAR
jgi:transglutaminase-like putative cysteine protease